VNVRSRSSDSESLRVLLGGDFYTGPRLDKYGLPQDAPDFVDQLPEAIDRVDAHLLNLEAPVTTRSDTAFQKRYWLRNPPKLALPLLEELSVDAVSLANNHMLDYGMKGVVETTSWLKEAGIRYTGVGANVSGAAEPIYLERQGRRLAFLAFSNTFPREFWAETMKPGTAYGDPDLIKQSVNQAHKQADRVIVSFHWGSESTLNPKGYQHRLARLAVDAGADVVFGHHPHSLQPIERYNDGLIFYSLGNYFFSTLSKDVEYGLLADVEFYRNREQPQFKLHLLRVNNYQVHYRPKLVRTYKRPLALALRIGRLDFIRFANSSRLHRSIQQDYPRN
jgi:poly-gamma-glutamate synthesis protein (capsule biosynthesis protein)